MVNDERDRHAGEDIWERIQLDDVELKKIKFETADDPVKGSSRELVVSNKLNIKELSEERLVIENDVELSFKPKGLFELSLALEATYKLTEKEESKEFINRHLKEIGYPLLSKASLIVAFITEKVLDVPIILPPATTDGDE